MPSNRVFSNVGKAIEAYERQLISHGSPFDKYARALRTGDLAGEDLLSPAAKRGLKLFVGQGQCELCHSGPNFTDGQFHNGGLPLLPAETAERGREDGISLLLSNPFNAAGRYSDDPGGETAKRLKYLPKPRMMRGAFKTPTLRNLGLTGPYFHDGRFSTLGQVMQFYADGEAASKGLLIGRREETFNLIPHFTPEQIADLVAFLRSLDGTPVPTSLTHSPTQPSQLSR